MLPAFAQCAIEAGNPDAGGAPDLSTFSLYSAGMLRHRVGPDAGCVMLIP